MIEKNLWYEYLNLIDMISKCENDFGSIYGLNQKRIEYHNALIEYYSDNVQKFKEERFKEITDNLDRCIDFVPPLSLTDSLRVYVGSITRKINCAEYIFFLNGESDYINSLKKL
jgi:hypothetical protein